MPTTSVEKPCSAREAMARDVDNPSRKTATRIQSDCNYIMRFHIRASAHAAKQFRKRFFAALCAGAILQSVEAQQAWSFTADIEHVTYSQQAVPVETNILKAFGVIAGEAFLLHTPPSRDSYQLETHAGWDGTSSRWFEVISAGHGPFSENQLSSNRFVKPYIDASPVPRAAGRGIQGLTLAFLSPETLKALTAGGTNRLLLQQKLLIPEEYSSVEWSTDTSGKNITLIKAQATNWVWKSRGTQKDRYVLPRSFSVGFPHWRINVFDRDVRNSLPMHFTFETYFPNDRATNETSLVTLLSRVNGTMRYDKLVGSVSQWHPVLPVDHAMISDLRPGPALERLSSVTGMAATAFNVTNALWGMNSTLAEKENRTIVVRTANMERSTSPTLRWVLRILACGILIVPCVFMLRSRFR